MPWVHLLCDDGWMPSKSRAADELDPRLRGMWAMADRYAEALSGAVNMIDGGDPTRTIVATQVAVHFAELGPCLNVETPVVAFVCPGQANAETLAQQRARRRRFHQIVQPRVADLRSQRPDCEFPEVLTEVILVSMTGSITGPLGIPTARWGGA